MVIAFWAGVVMVILLSIVAALGHFLQINSDLTYGQLLWNLINQAVAPNQIDLNSGPPAFVFLMALVAIAGLLVLGALIAVATAAVDTRIQHLRRGRSRVCERGHTIILGYGEHTFTIIDQLRIHAEE